MTTVLDRRQLLRGAALTGGGLALAAHMPAWAQPVSAGIAKPLPTVSGEDIRLRVEHQRREATVPATEVGDAARVGGQHLGQHRLAREPRLEPADTAEVLVDVRGIVPAVACRHGAHDALGQVA